MEVFDDIKALLWTFFFHLSIAHYAFTFKTSIRFGRHLSVKCWHKSALKLAQNGIVLPETVYHFNGVFYNKF
jgi:hypothetical protein